MRRRTSLRRNHSAPYATVDDRRIILDQVAVNDQRAKNYPPNTFTDTRFVKQLEDRGYIKSLYPKNCIHHSSRVSDRQ
jgi:hypothetical protein